MKKSTDFLIEQQIFLGGQVSHKHEVFKEIAHLSPEYAELFCFLKYIPEWEQLDDDKLILNIIELFGEIDFVRGCSELTKLSMILGDTRQRFDVKGVMDELRSARSNSST